MRPHPHIGLATVTFLFDGEIMHRDSLGTAVPIRPGEVNWMTAGRGIVHSERTAPERRIGGEPLHGLQCWVALPADDEEIDAGLRACRQRRAADRHRQRQDACAWSRAACSARARRCRPCGTRCSPRRRSPPARRSRSMPTTEERALYVVDGEIDIAGDTFAPGRLLIFRPGDAITVTAASDARVVLVGGAAMDGPRHIWWNFVSSRKDRIEQAKADWKAGRFDTVPGDESEFIPLPE